MNRHAKAGTNRDKRYYPERRNRYDADVGRTNPVEFVLEGTSASTGQTSVALEHGGLLIDPVGIPVVDHMRATEVSVAWASNTSFAEGDLWTITLQRRAYGTGVFEDVATYDFDVSNGSPIEIPPDSGGGGGGGSSTSYFPGGW